MSEIPRTETALNSDYPISCLHVECIKLEEELTAVTAERDALTKDSKRLDWLEDVAADFDFKRLARHGNIRAYVDAANEVRGE